MTALLVTSVASGDELDRVTLDDEGRLAYRTGAARDLFEGRRRLLARGAADGDAGAGEVTDADLVDELTGWSNGYIVIRAAGESAGQPQE